MPLSCGWNDLNAAFMSYETECRAGMAVTGVHQRLCGTTGTVPHEHAPFTINKLAGNTL
jgi:hypothetical protein